MFENISSFIDLLVCSSLLSLWFLFVMDSKYLRLGIFAFVLSVSMMVALERGIYPGLFTAIIFCLLPLLVAPIVWLVSKALLFKVEKEYGKSGIDTKFDIFAGYKYL